MTWSRANGSNPVAQFAFGIRGCSNLATGGCKIAVGAQYQLIQKVKEKVGLFRPEYAGKMNFYLNTADDRLRRATGQPSIGLILWQDKNRIVAEPSGARPIRCKRTRRARRRPSQYALRGMDKAIGVSEYQLTRALPKKLQSALPSIAQIEAELSTPAAAKPATKARGGKRP